MKTIFDISVLGMGYYYPKSRTGVHRVVENLAKGLVTDELAFSAIDSLPGAMRYAQSQWSNPFVHTANEINLATAENKLLRFTSQNSFLEKAIRASFRKIRSTFLPTEFQLNTKELSNYKLFHSPYFPIPKVVQRHPTLRSMLTIHDLIPIRYPHFFGNETNHIVEQIVKSLPQSGFAICVSEATKADFLDYTGFAQDQVFVTPLAADPDIFFPCTDKTLINNTLQQYQIPIEQPYLLSLATLEPRKNTEQVIKSFVQLIQQEAIQDLNLVLVGTKGWDFDRIFEAIDHAGQYRNRIFVTGYVPDTHLSALYSGALSFVYPSFAEGFGLPPLEAMQCGLPVITSNTTSLPEVVGTAGITLSPTDGEALCQAMLEVYKNSALRHKLSTKSLERAAQFSWQKTIEQTNAIYLAIR